MKSLLNNHFSYAAEIILGKDFFSSEFLTILDEKLTNDFLEKTKLNHIPKEIYLKLSPQDFVYKIDNEIQYLKVKIYVRNTSFSTTICWKKHSRFGLLIRPYDTNITEKDIEIKFLDLPSLKILAEYNDFISPYLGYNNYSFAVKVDYFSLDLCYLIINGDDLSQEKISNSLYSTVNSFNKSKNRKIHNISLHKETPRIRLIYKIDLGSAANDGLEILLNKLNDFKEIQNINITSAAL